MACSVPANCICCMATVAGGKRGSGGSAAAWKVRSHTHLFQPRKPGRQGPKQLQPLHGMASAWHSLLPPAPACRRLLPPSAGGMRPHSAAPASPLPFPFPSIRAARSLCDADRPAGRQGRRAGGGRSSTRRRSARSLCGDPYVTWQRCRRHRACSRRSWGGSCSAGQVRCPGAPGARQTPLQGCRGRGKRPPACRGSNPNQTRPPPDAGRRRAAAARAPSPSRQCTAAPLWPSSPWRAHAAAP